MRPIWAQKQN